MPCNDCSQTPITILGFSQLVTPSDCGCPDCPQGQTPVPASCIYYQGATLPCTQIINNDSFDVILSKLDTAICAITGDYSTYNKFCLNNIITITTEQQFVETISNYVCNLNSIVSSFINTTYANFLISYQNTIDGITHPGITCSIAGVNPSDTLVTVLQKYCLALQDANNNINVSTANWNQCFTVSPLPANLVQAFNVVLDQICQVKNLSSGALPTFNNIGSCLGAPLTAADTLVDTINKIKTKLCSLPAFTTAGVTWGCVSVGTNLQTAIQNILTKIQSISINSVQAVSSDFTLVPIDSLNPCLGNRLIFNPGIIDRKFSLNAGDSTNGYFLDKITPGTNIAFDTVTTPGTVIINVPTPPNDKVKAFSADANPSNFLDQKLEGDTDTGSGITIGLSNDGAANKVKISPSINKTTLLNALFDLIESDPTLHSRFCSIVASCVEPPESGEFRVTNTVFDMSITDVTPHGAYNITSGNFPVPSGDQVVGTTNGITSTSMVVTIIGGHGASCNLVLFKNGVPIECIDLTAGGTYTFATATFLPTDDMRIDLSSGACP